MHAFLDHGNITAPPILDEFNFLARGLRAGDEGAFAGPWPSDRAAWRRRHQKYRSHQHKAAQAQQVLAKLETFKGNGDAKRILGYLRKIDPYVFEELVLLMLERQGIVVIRNESYSGDGGWTAPLSIRVAAICSRPSATKARSMRRTSRTLPH